MVRARHIEVQVLGDGVDVVALGERECTLRGASRSWWRSRPSRRCRPSLRPTHHPGRPGHGAREVRYEGLGTFSSWWTWRPATCLCCRIQPRTGNGTPSPRGDGGVDLGAAQICIGGKPPPAAWAWTRRSRRAQGHAIQWRINAETLAADGSAHAGKRHHLTRLHLRPGRACAWTHSVAGPGALAAPRHLLAADRPRAAAVLPTCCAAARALAETPHRRRGTNVALLQALPSGRDMAGRCTHALAGIGAARAAGCCANHS